MESMLHAGVVIGGGYVFRRRGGAVGCLLLVFLLLADYCQRRSGRHRWQTSLDLARCACVASTLVRWLAFVCLLSISAKDATCSVCMGRASWSRRARRPRERRCLRCAGAHRGRGNCGGGGPRACALIRKFL